jgi:hypothetical protein
MAHGNLTPTRKSSVAAYRPELRHAGQIVVNREAELNRPSRVACSDLLGGVFMVFDKSNRQSTAHIPFFRPLNDSL